MAATNTEVTGFLKEKSDAEIRSVMEALPQHIQEKVLNALVPEAAEGLLMSGAQWALLMNGMIKVVVLAILIERMLAWFYGIEGVSRYVFRTPFVPAGESVTSGADADRYRVPRRTFKSLIPFVLAVVVCWLTNLNLLIALFPADEYAANQPFKMFGVLVTAVVVAGGSEGAISVFQVFMGWNKKARDLRQDATREEAEARIAIAKAEKEEALARHAHVQAAAGVGGTTTGSGAAAPNYMPHVDALLKEQGKTWEALDTHIYGAKRRRRGPTKTMMQSTPGWPNAENSKLRAKIAGFLGKRVAEVFPDP